MLSAFEAVALYTEDLKILDIRNRKSLGFIMQRWEDTNEDECVAGLAIDSLKLMLIAQWL